MVEMSCISNALDAVRVDITELLAAPIVPLHEALVPNSSGVYIFYSEDRQVLYVGEARGRHGLRDRILSKQSQGMTAMLSNEPTSWSIQIGSSVASLSDIPYRSNGARFPIRCELL